MNLQKELRLATMKTKRAHRQVPKPEAVVTQLLRGLQPTPDLGSTQPLVWLGEEGEMWHWGGPQRAVEVTGLPKTYLREWGRACVPSYTSWARSLGIANHSSATAITSFVIPYFMCYFSCISSHDLSYLSSLPRSFFLIALGCKNQRFRK